MKNLAQTSKQLTQLNNQTIICTKNAKAFIAKQQAKHKLAVCSATVEKTKDFVLGYN